VVQGRRAHQLGTADQEAALRLNERRHITLAIPVELRAVLQLPTMLKELSVKFVVTSRVNRKDVSKYNVSMVVPSMRNIKSNNSG
jgi:hypothetical protein